MSTSSSAPPTDAERIRAIGLFDLQDTLPGLLAALAAFFEKHRVSEPVEVSWERDPSRGWRARIELKPGDYLRVVEAYPMPTHLSVVRGSQDDPHQLHLQTELRAGWLSARLPLDAFQGRIEGGALVLRPAGR